jgi:hypothetical protein
MVTTQWYFTAVGHMTSNHTEFPRTLKPHLTGYAVRTTTVMTRPAACVRTPTVKINGRVITIFLLWKVPIITRSSNLNTTAFPSYQKVHTSCIKIWNTWPYRHRIHETLLCLPLRMIYCYKYFGFPDVNSKQFKFMLLGGSPCLYISEPTVSIYYACR